MRCSYGLMVFRCSLLFALSYIALLVLIGFVEYWLKLGISDYANIISLVLAVMISKSATTKWGGRPIVIRESVAIAATGMLIDFLIQFGVVLYFKGHEMLSLSNIALTVMVALGHGLILLIGFISVPSILHSAHHES